MSAHRRSVAEQFQDALAAGGVRSGDPVLVMVSAGADSTLLALLAVEARLMARGLHVAHGLRGSASDDDADFCRQLPLPVEVVDGAVVEGPNLEARLRDVRRAAALRACAEDPILTGHTATDRAETILYRLATSGGPNALPALRMSAPPFLRPLIGVTRQEVRAELRLRGEAWREDASNDDPAFARNRIRNEVLPVLLALNPRADANLARTGALAEDERDLIRSLSLALLEPDGTIAAERIAEAHPALRREAIRLAAEQAGARVQHADVEALATGAGARSLPGGDDAAWSAGRLRFRVR